MRYLLVLCLLFLAGCGGGSRRSGPPLVDFPQSNPDRTGTWKGRQTDAISGQSGNLTLVIGANRSLSGAWQTDAGVSWTISGTVADDTITRPPDNTVQMRLTAAGQADRNGTGTLVVGITNHLGGRIIGYTPMAGFLTPTTPVALDFTVDLVRQ